MSIRAVPAPENYPELQSILTKEKRPEGVVFEVVEWDIDALTEAIPWLNRQIVTLRSMFPKLDIAIVSHGGEQFALLNSNKEIKMGIHTSVQHLISEHSIKLELCLGHAKMRGFQAADFPQYVTIETTGPSRIMTYEDLGYVVVTF